MLGNQRVGETGNLYAQQYQVGQPAGLAVYRKVHCQLGIL